jgi:pimeloyl-ACP methyl ester carboxylesterase
VSSVAAAEAFVPALELAKITEPAALDVAAALRRVPVDVAGKPVLTAHVPPAERGTAPPLVCVHGFDSSSLEFRRFLPVLRAAGVEAWALDVFGCGFTQFAPGSTCTPEDRRAHLLAFIQTVVGRPVVLLGASLGASTAVDLAVEHPEWVTGLVLVDGQAFESAPQLPGPLAAIGVNVLRQEWLRDLANRLAYHDKAKYATQDAMLVGRLHTHLPSWADANVAFIASGGYRCADKVAAVSQPALVVWGAQDEIVPPATSERFKQALKSCKVVMVEACGHVPHLEQPAALRDAVTAFMATLKA